VDAILLLDFFSDPKRVVKIGFSEHLDELDRVTRSDSNGGRGAQSDRISPLVAASLSDLAVVSEIERALNWHQPRIMAHGENEELLEDMKGQRIPLLRVCNASVDLEVKLTGVGIPMSKFNYPCGKRLTAPITKRMRDAERHLDEFWRVVDEHYSQKLGKTIHGFLSDLKVLTPRELERTPEWIDNTPKPEITPSTVAAAFSELNIEEQAPEPQTTPVKVKVKTRGTVPPAVDAVAELVFPLPQPGPETIIVNKRAHKVFTSIFYDPTAEIPAGEIPWTEFLYALSSVGFAIENSKDQLGYLRHLELQNGSSFSTNLILPAKFQYKLQGVMGGD
jgi:hypothetical protein